MLVNDSWMNILMFARVWSCPSSCSLSLMENAENDNGGIMLMFTTTSYHQLVYTTSSSSSSSSTSSSLTSNLNLKEHQGRLFVLHFKVIPCLYNFSVRFWEDHRGLQGSLRYLKFFRSVQGNKKVLVQFRKKDFTTLRINNPTETSFIFTDFWQLSTSRPLNISQ